ncbi:TPA: CDP-diacylglycerol--glycerol-3-phosphate 3-phosphatidyltransferase [Neisseria meningitidis]|uniref:CDP-diacylglycerol--glycerol-3-phosphate 3-phosphatidyltransferase n=1 Tax=Neisseria meningitidis TaxID=487 RepID=UPI000C32E895|nr:CDP-diacylglycerol--glycerol-3-phosphate 3-phosphatidyltransferase [Neisseria meningitidis]
MPWNLPIFLTWLRVLLIPVMTALFYLPFPWFAEETINLTAAVIFAVAALTDWFDGFLARLWKQTSDFGAFLDPVADKLMVAVSLLLLVKLDRTYVLFAMIIIGREITISALREWMAQMGKRNSVAVATVGKFKTAAQMLAIFLLLLNFPDFYGFNLVVIGNVLMFIASLLTVWSMLYYLKMAWKEIA